MNRTLEKNSPAEMLRQRIKQIKRGYCAYAPNPGDREYLLVKSKDPSQRIAEINVDTPFSGLTLQPTPDGARYWVAAYRDPQGNPRFEADDYISKGHVNLADAVADVKRIIEQYESLTE